jgi:membrane protein DedA with SNARE-associated domain
MALMVALGDRLREVWRNPSAENLTVLALIVAGWLALVFGLQYVISKRRKKQG